MYKATLLVDNISNNFCYDVRKFYGIKKLKKIVSVQTQERLSRVTIHYSNENYYENYFQRKLMKSQLLKRVIK